MSNFFAAKKVKVTFSITALAAMAIIGVGLGIGNNLAFNRYASVLSHYLAPPSGAK